MKKLLAIALLASSSVVMADQDVGCGLGTMVWAGQSGLGPKVLAATTNGVVFGNQTFGITSGTLGCQADGVISSRARLGMFMSTNSERLARDMSVGRGETLEVLANLLNIKAEDKPTFFQATQTHFGKIFAPENKTSGDVLAALHKVMAQDSKLAAYAG